ncbi:MAG: epoxyqueuosine reductase, partial [bacterium]
ALFERYRTIIGPFHETPCRILERAGGGQVPVEGTVVCWVLPVQEGVRRSNCVQSRHPSRMWARTRDLGERFNDQLRVRVVETLTALGGLAVAPVLSDMWTRVDDAPVGLASTWSERHAAFAAGLGTFSINGGLITRLGIAHRVGSVVTDIVLEPTPRPYRDYREYCLTCRGIPCGVCMTRCPAGVISQEGHDKDRCRSYTYSQTFRSLAREYGVSVTGCGLCQTAVPCEDRIPEG